MRRLCVSVGLFFVMDCLVLSSLAQDRAVPTAPAPSEPASMSSRASADTHGTALPSATSSNSSVESKLRIEGEKRFRTNCGRCHMAPHKFPPRVMATAIRHMRVRAMLTDEDMRLILGYMTQ